MWFTVAGGVLSDVYWPNVDATNVHTLQYLVTDGQQLHRPADARHDLHGAAVADRDGVHGERPQRTHDYRITTTYIADPSRDAVLMRVRFDGPRGDHVYVRLDPLAGGTGGGGTQNAGGNSASSSTSRRPGPRRLEHEHDDQRRQPRLRGPDVRGAAGVDGLLDRERRLCRHRERRPVDARRRSRALTDLHRRAGRPRRADRRAQPARATGSLTLALGFGTNADDGDLATADRVGNAALQPRPPHYERQWRRYDATLSRPSRR